MATMTNEGGARTAGFKPVDAGTLRRWLDGAEAMVIDVREAGEFARERLPGSELVPLSRFDPSQVPDAGGKKLVMHCRGGTRSVQACQKLVAARTSAEVWYLDGGIEAWKAAGLPILSDPKTRGLDPMRQTQLVIGMMVLAGLALGVLVSPWFLLLSAMPGAGLVMAGVTGFCPLMLMIARLPFNRRAVPAATCCDSAAK